MSNSRIYPRARPQMRQRRTALTRYLGVFFAFSILALVARIFTSSPERDAPHSGRNGMPSRPSNSRASSSLRAVVAMVTSIPRTFSTLS